MWGIGMLSCRLRVGMLVGGLLGLFGEELIWPSRSAGGTGF
jgi:hypothetical protein